MTWKVLEIETRGVIAGSYAAPSSSLLAPGSVRYTSSQNPLNQKLFCHGCCLSFDHLAFPSVVLFAAMKLVSYQKPGDPIVKNLRNGDNTEPNKMGLVDRAH